MVGERGTRPSASCTSRCPAELNPARGRQWRISSILSPPLHANPASLTITRSPDAPIVPISDPEMDSRNQGPIKSSSFSSVTTKSSREVDRNLSLGALRHADHHQRSSFATDQIKEEDEEVCRAAAAGDVPGISALSAEIDAFIRALAGDAPVRLPEATIERFAAAVEMEVARCESARGKWWVDEPPALLAAISRVAALASAIAMSPEATTAGGHRVSGVLHRAMAFLEDEFHALLEPSSDSCKLMRRPPSFEKVGHESDRCVFRPAARNGAGGESAPPYPAETVDRLRSIADTMVTAGYATECAQMFLVARRNTFDASLLVLGYEKVSMDDVGKMTWEALEMAMATWVKAFRHTIHVGLSREHDLCARVYPGRHAAVGRSTFADLARCVMFSMLNFTDGVVMTKRSTEKLFKVLDMYEAIRDASPVIDAFLSAGGEPSDADRNSNALADLKGELVVARSRLGDLAVTIFGELENSIRADAGKQPVPGGAVHPLTRYVMNYVKYMCAYSNTLENLLREHRRHDGGGEGNPFAAQLTETMELLQANLEGKSRLYKDPALSSIFLMNNGRYMLQKMKGSPETNAALGETWSRKQSTNLRQYHKNYQRETWSRVLTLLHDDGAITVKGHVQKPVLKERFKQFNAAMDEIHRTQGAWIVSDEQLQSELRVSIAAVVVPAYRSFLGRFSQTFSGGRQSGKYVKLSAEDLEGIIDDLFDGTAASMSRRR